jgi:tetrapyrrole methylase family protein / MazG family protein
MKISNPHQQAEKNLKKLLEIIHKLRSPDGCLWDRQQKKGDMAKYLVDETYELVDAIDRDCPLELKEEMGDLLFQILFLAKLSEEAGDFSISDVMEDVTNKMIRRHPHVFGNKKVRNVEEIRSNWEDIKKHVENRNINNGSLLDGVPRSTPSLLKAQKITAEASKVGFDWGNADEVLVKIEEELIELKSALKTDRHENIKEEIGDLFLSLVNFCRFTDVNAEEALTDAIKKFSSRFQYIQDALAAKGKTPEVASLEEMDNLWNESKRIKKD